MDPLEALPAGWRVWHAEENGRLILAYRPDVFDGEAFPAACLPTVTVAPGRSPDARPEARERSGVWHVALYLEPDVRVRAVGSSVEDRAAAVERAVAVARAFDAGEVDLREAYHEPRAGYLDRLEALTGAGR